MQAYKRKYLDHYGIGEQDVVLCVCGQVAVDIHHITFRSQGGTDEISVDLRLITATNRNLEAMVASGAFRQDLFYRVQVASQTLPPLREVASDVECFCEYFIQEFNREFRKEIQGISSDAMDLLKAWEWPGNVRELRNVLERACIFCQGDEIGVTEIPVLSRPVSEASPGPFVFEAAFPVPKGLTLAEAEGEYIRHTLAALDDNVQRAAESLGISRKNLWEKRKKHGLME
jgi:two-component system response regulator HydG